MSFSFAWKIPSLPPTWSKEQTLIHHGCMRPKDMQNCEDKSYHDQSPNPTVDGGYNLL